MPKCQKKYYWLKLKEDFFDDDTISFIEEQENGVYYINFYLKLCLKSIKTNGKLIRLIGEVLIPYDIKSLSKLTSTPPDTVRVAMKLFQEIGLVKLLESGEIYLSQIEEMIGSETDKARLMRESRARKSIGNNVTTALPQCYPEKEKEIEIDTEIEKKKKKKAPLPTLEELQTRFSDSVSATVLEWLTYKHEKNEDYYPTGLKSLLTQIANKVAKYGEHPVVDLIQLSMANGWKGIIWDKLQDDKGGKSNGKSDRPAETGYKLDVVRL